MFLINDCTSYSLVAVIGIIVLSICSGFLGATIKEMIDNATECNELTDEDDEPHEFI